MKKRGQITVYIIVGIVILISIILILLLRNLGVGDGSDQTTWVQPIDVFMGECIEDELESAVTQMIDQGGYLFDATGIPDGFQRVPLEMDPAVSVPIFMKASRAVPIEVFPADPDMVEDGSAYPCFDEAAGATCGESDFNHIFGFPFGVGATGVYESAQKPRLTLYSENTHHYLPRCKDDNCRYSLESQLEYRLEQSIPVCYEEAKTRFAVENIDISFETDLTADVDIKPERVILHSLRNTRIKHPKGMIVNKEEFSSEMNTMIARLFVLTHGGSTETVLNGQGIIEAEARDPEFLIERDGKDVLQNVFYLEPYDITISTAGYDYGSLLVEVNDEENDISWPFLVMNRAPYFSMVEPHKIVLRSFTYQEVDSGFNLDDVAYPDVYADVTYYFYVDAKDPDDHNSESFFGSYNDGLAIDSVVTLPSDTYEVLDNPGNCKGSICSVTVRFREGYTLGDEINNPDTGEVIEAPTGKKFLYIENIDEGLPIGISLSDSMGNEDFIKMYLSLYLYYRPGLAIDEDGNPIPIDGIVIDPGTDEPNNDQNWPWIIIAGTKRDPLDNVIYLYTDNPDAMFTKEQIGSVFIPDIIPESYAGLGHEIIKTHIEIIEENHDFALNDKCPDRNLAETLKDLGICSYELCCLPVMDLGNEIRFIERSATCANRFSDECNLHTNYMKLGGTFHLNYSSEDASGTVEPDEITEYIPFETPEEDYIINPSCDDSSLIDTGCVFSPCPENDDFCVEEKDIIDRMFKITFNTDAVELDDFEYNETYNVPPLHICQEETPDVPSDSWWDYRETLENCNEGFDRRTDPIDGPEAVSYIDMTGFGTDGCCPSLKEAIGSILDDEACLLAECCITPHKQRYFVQFDSSWDPDWFRQYPHTGMVYPAGMQEVAMKSFLERDPAEQGMYEAFITTEQPTYRLVEVRGRMLNHRYSLRDLMEGEEYGRPFPDMTTGDVCSMSGCTEGIPGYSPEYLADFGIDPQDIGTNGCPDPESADELAQKGICNIEDCCLEIAPGCFNTGTGSGDGIRDNEWLIPELDGDDGRPPRPDIDDPDIDDDDDDDNDDDPMVFDIEGGMGVE